MPLAAAAEVETKTKTGTGTETEPNYIAGSDFRTTKQRQARPCRSEYPSSGIEPEFTV